MVFWVLLSLPPPPHSTPLQSPHHILPSLIKKIYQAFGVNVYRWPASQDEAQRRLVTLNASLADKDTLCAGLLNCN